MQAKLRIFEANILPSMDAIRAYQDWLLDDRPDSLRNREYGPKEKLPTYDAWVKERDYPLATVITETKITWADCWHAMKDGSQAFWLWLLGLIILGCVAVGVYECVLFCWHMARAGWVYAKVMGWF